MVQLRDINNIGLSECQWSSSYGHNFQYRNHDHIPSIIFWFRHKCPHRCSSGLRQAPKSQEYSSLIHLPMPSLLHLHNFTASVQYLSNHLDLHRQHFSTRSRSFQSQRILPGLLPRHPSNLPLGRNKGLRPARKGRERRSHLLLRHRPSLLILGWCGTRVWSSGSMVWL